MKDVQTQDFSRTLRKIHDYRAKYVTNFDNEENKISKWQWENRKTRCEISIKQALTQSTGPEQNN